LLNNKLTGTNPVRSNFPESRDAATALMP